MFLDITAASFKRNPYPAYAALRAEAGVVEVSAGRGRKVWLAARYDSSVSLLKDERLVKDRSKVPGGRLPWMPGFAKPLARNMLDLDDPDHRRLRALVHQAFTPRLVEQMRQRIDALTREMLERAGPRRRIDVIADFDQP